ncbi:hypothetical protein EVAR_34708_1 [Eumeta japonica]|uniref:Uncharacterized protein n=1 Tax=Eumeta variegata TaxID=151549 RepID=A0A4C1XER1_EUMVA|nr:hypothetical protein EVAR_34708_1 [Eumeta japonica]
MYVRNIKTVLKRTTARSRKLGATNAIERYVAHFIASSLHSFVPFRCQSVTVRCRVRRLSDEAKHWQGYLKRDMRMRSAMHQVWAAGAEINKYNRNNKKTVVSIG